MMYTRPYLGTQQRMSCQKRARLVDAVTAVLGGQVGRHQRGVPVVADKHAALAVRKARRLPVPARSELAASALCSSSLIRPHSSSLQITTSQHVQPAYTSRLWPSTEPAETIHLQASNQEGVKGMSCARQGIRAVASTSCEQGRGPAPVAADLQLQRRLAGGQAEQRVPELVVAKHAVLIAVRVPCKLEVALSDRRAHVGAGGARHAHYRTQKKLQQRQK